MMRCWSPVGPALRVRGGFAGGYLLGPAYLDPRPTANTLWTYRDACARVVVDRGTTEEVTARARARQKPCHSTRRFQP